MPAASPSRLYILRHAHSSWALPGQRDHQRGLDERGRGDAPRVGAEIARLGCRFDAVVCSTALRAMETLEAMRAHLDPPFREETCDALYAHGVEAYYAASKRHGHAASVLLIGHNPMVEEFTRSLAPMGEDSAMMALGSGFPTAGLAIVDLDGPLSDLAPGGGWLAALIHPKTLREAR